MDCQYCKKTLSSKSSLNYHQKNTKFCLALQGKTINKSVLCDFCKVEFSSQTSLTRHSKICKDRHKNMSDELHDANKEIEMLRNTINELRLDKKDLQERYDKLSLTAVKRPVTTNKNIQINNYIQQMEPIKMVDITQSVPMLTLDHHVKGAEGYAEFALEFPFKNRIVCVDVNRNKIKYKNDEGDLIEDVGFRKMMTKLCIALKERSFSLSQEHYEKLSDSFSDSEMDGINFMETALAITKCANGKETDFCNKIIKIIGKGANVANRGIY
jgi:hypothetical protein